ncbi:protein kinase domain-containing protein [Aliikangiella sp. IMCC44653]
MALPFLEGYKIKQKFASGGMAQIYDAIQTSLNRPVAIKFLSEQLLSHAEAKALFEHESLIIAQLHHPNIVQIIDKGISEESLPYFVMEKINGIDLAELLTQGELPFSKKIDIALQICRGLAYAHRNDVIHRDIKPSNIIIDQHGQVKILDFGIALNEVSSEQSTQQTSVVGTAGYVAPEQASDYSGATIKSDIYSTGVVLYDLFGRPVKDSRIRTSVNRLPKDLPADLYKVLAKCCAKNPAQRYQSLTQVRDELLRISQGQHLDKSNKDSVEKENKDLASNFNLLDVLSQSKNKRVLLFQKKSNKQLLVIRRNHGDTQGIVEAKKLISLKHPNIVKVLAAVKNQNNMTIISEYLSGGSLNNQLIQDFTEEAFFTIACKICAGLDYAHQNKILHKNLCPNNILFDDKHIPKLGDFGLPYTDEEELNSIKNYRPPQQQSINEQYDIYCLGAIFHHMLFGAPPGMLRNKKPQKISFRLQKLLDQMLALDPLSRPQSAQLVLLELNRMANSEKYKRKRSKIGQPNEPKKKHKKVKHKEKQVPKSSSTMWLSIALFISILCIIGLLLKDFIR